MSDLATIAALRLGDQFVFERVFYEYHQKLYFYIYGRTHSPYASEEIVQMTFIKLWQYREGLDENIPLSGQVFRIAKTTLIDLVRKEARRVHAPGPEGYPEDGGGGPERMEAKDLNERIYRAVQGMPGIRQKVFAMSRYKGMSYREIADELSISVRTVENHISQALKQLRHFIPFL